jgi:proliferating cell nuclear antigen
MNILISDKKKKETFVSLFQVLKNCSSVVNIMFNIEHVHIQGMDKSHICLFNIKITKEWFSNYDIKEVTKISFDTNIFHSIISTKSDYQDLIIIMDDVDQDILHINFLSQEKESKKNEFNKFFKMPLIEYEYEEMNIPNVDYEAEFSLSSKQITDMFSQLSNFGSDIIIKCSEEDINLTTNGINGEMKVDIPIDDLTSYSIVEGELILLSYSLTYINKMCITNKLTSDIDFSLSNEIPMKISYNLGEDSFMEFFIAPKIDE